jgi:hypothetical protein
VLLLATTTGKLEQLTCHSKACCPKVQAFAAKIYDSKPDSQINAEIAEGQSVKR